MWSDWQTPRPTLSTRRQAKSSVWRATKTPTIDIRSKIIAGGDEDPIEPSSRRAQVGELFRDLPEAMGEIFSLRAEPRLALVDEHPDPFPEERGEKHPLAIIEWLALLTPGYRKAPRDVKAGGSF